MNVFIWINMHLHTNFESCIYMNLHMYLPTNDTESSPNTWEIIARQNHTCKILFHNNLDNHWERKNMREMCALSWIKIQKHKKHMYVISYLPNSWIIDATITLRWFNQNYPQSLRCILFLMINHLQEPPMYPL
jgi:hypothetical protein